MQQVRDLAALCGWRCYHTFDSRRSQGGFPDLLLVKPGRLVVAELKRDGGEPTPEQALWLEAFRQVPGAEVYLWRPGGWSEIERVLTAPNVQTR